MRIALNLNVEIKNGALVLTAFVVVARPVILAFFPKAFTGG